MIRNDNHRRSFQSDDERPVLRLPPLTWFVLAILGIASGLLMMRFVVWLCVVIKGMMG